MKKMHFVILITLAISSLMLVSLVYGKPQIAPIAKPFFQCDMNYTDITPSIMQRLLQAQYSPGNIFLRPNKLNDRIFTMNIYPNSGPTLYHYLYDIGADGLWNTSDDRATYISSDFYSEMITQDNNGVYQYFWVSSPSPVTQQFSIYSCDLSSGCINRNNVAIINPPDEIAGIVPSASQGKLYLAMINTASNPQGTIYSCSLQNNAPDSCSSTPNFYNTLGNFDLLMSSLQDDGFFIKRNQAQPNQIDFFNINYLSSFSLPLGLEPNSINSAHIPGLIFTFNPTYPSVQPLSTINLNLFTGSVTPLNNLPSGINPKITDFLSNGIAVVYSLSNPYRQFIKINQNQEVEIYRTNSSLNVPQPLTLQSDSRVIGLISNSTGTRILRSNCHG